MAISGLVGAGAQDALLELLAQRRLQEQLAEQMRAQRAQEAIQQQRLSQDAQQHGDLLGFREKQLGQQGEQFERSRRDRSNEVGLRQMGEDRQVWEGEQNQRALDEMVGSLPEGSARRVVNLRRRGITGVNAEDLMTPEERAGEEDAMVRRAGRIADAQAGAAARHRPPPASARAEMTPGQSYGATRALRNDFVRETSAAREVTNQLGLMQESLKAARRGDLAAGSQGILVTFQKILDPTSVVRESEYARSASGQSLLSRIEGAATKLAAGGAGVPVQELEAFVRLAEQFASRQQAAARDAGEQIKAIAEDYGLNPERIIRDYGPSDNEPPPPKEPDTAPKRMRFDAKGNPIP